MNTTLPQVHARLIIDPIGNGIYTMTQYFRQPDTLQYQDYPDADRHR
jgi:hypothetical protein